MSMDNAHHPLVVIATYADLFATTGSPLSGVERIASRVLSAIAEEVDSIPDALLASPEFVEAARAAVRLCLVNRFT